MYITFGLIAIELTLKYIFKLGDIAAWISPFIWVSLAFQLYYGISAILKVKTKILNAEIATAQAEADRIRMDFQRQQQTIVLERRLNPAGNISYFVDGVPIEEALTGIKAPKEKTISEMSLSELKEKLIKHEKVQEFEICKQIKDLIIIRELESGERK